MKWLNAVIKTGFNLNLRKVQHAVEQPEATQQQVFEQLIRQASKTEFGKQYDFASITSMDRFRERVPVHTYEDIKPYIQQMMQGTPNILSPGKVDYFSRSSGTTNNKSKYIPVPYENLKHCHLKGAHDAVTI